MKSKRVTGAMALCILAVSFVALALSLGMITSASASDARTGQLHVTKDCAAYDRLPGGHCTIVSSNLPEIPAGSNVYYDQQLGIPTGLLDSNVVLDAGHGDRALGRCTLDLSTGLGLCTFSDGTGQLAGFTARINVSHLSGTLWAWDGTYRFRHERDR